MEFRCRLGTPGGEIIEGVYVAESEARLRREFEEKGLYVLGIQRAGARRARWRPGFPRGPRVDAGVPRVQPGAGDAAQGRACRSCSRSISCASASPTRSSRRCSTTCTSGCGRAARCRSVRGARGAVPRRLHGVAAGRREERQPRAGHPPLRRLREGRVGRSGGRRSPRWSIRPSSSSCRSSSSASSCCRSCRSSRRSTSSSARQLPLSTRIIIAVSEFAGTYFLLMLLGGRRVAAAAFWAWLRQPGQRARFDRWMLRLPMLGPIARSSRRRRWRGRWRRCSAAASRWSTRWTSRRDRSSNRYMAHELRRRLSRCAKGGPRGRAERQRRVSRRGDQDGRGGRVDRRAAGDAQQPRRLLRRGDRDEPRRGSSRSSSRSCSSSWASSSRGCCWRCTCRCSTVVVLSSVG